jgi:hypothetical protein
MKWLPLGRARGRPAPGREAMDKPPTGHPQQLQVQLDPQDAEGTYSNFVLLAHSPSEFFLDFARILPGVPRAKVYSRVIMTPQTARSLLKALEAKIEAYENQFGKIRVEGDPSSTRDIGFKTG